MRRALWSIGMCVALAGSSSGEIVGPYVIIAAPVEAELLAGGGASFDWLNVVNTPVSVDEAFTGLSVSADGFANAQSGTVVRLTFAPGTLVNRPGPDLVLLDAGNDLNVYVASTSHDGFTQSLVLNAITDTGEDRAYFQDGAGPAPHDVLAASIDLSSFDVPEGVSVAQVRLFTEGPSNDLLGLGVLAGTPVPAAPAWGILALGLLVLAVGAVLLVRR